MTYFCYPSIPQIRPLHGPDSDVFLAILIRLYLDTDGVLSRFAKFVTFFGILSRYEDLNDESTSVTAKVCDKLTSMKKIYRTSFNGKPTFANLPQPMLEINLTEFFPNLRVALALFICFCESTFQYYEDGEEFQPIYNV
jgi:hypothetical protein